MTVGPGSVIFLPSALVEHGNVPIQEGETRMSFTQFAAGALFRWVHYGYRTERSILMDDLPAHRALREEAADRWTRFLGLFSHLSDLARDRLPLL